MPFFFGEGGVIYKGLLIKVITSLAPSGVGIEYQAFFPFACLFIVKSAPYERNNGSHAASDDELNSNPTFIQASALLMLLLPRAIFPFSSFFSREVIVKR